MMFRNQTRRGIRAVQAGHDPIGLCREAGVVIATYSNDTVMRRPPDQDSAIDRRRMREAGRRLADGYLKDPPLLASTDIEATRQADDPSFSFAITALPPKGIFR